MNEKFYANDYWVTGQGKNLWQLRLITSVLSYVNSTNNLRFFFTHLANDKDETIDGYFAEWNFGKHMMTVEVEEQTLSVFVYEELNEEKEKHRIWLFGEENDPDNRPWSELLPGLQEAKEWLDEAYMHYPKETHKVTVETQLTNLVSHL